ncbi:MAG: gamma-glutamyltransferase [Actinomycetota bacterium]
MSIAGPSSVVTGAAADIGEQGGTVVDVAIVAALTAMCTEPGVCGPGGGGFLTIDLPGHDPVVIDGYMAFPGKGFDGDAFITEVEMPYGGGVRTLVGAGSVAVPGVFAALGAASQMYGLAPWSELMEGVAVVVEDGFPLSAPCHIYLNDGAASIYAADPVAREALLDGDGPKPLGSRVVFPGLADSLRHLGREGPGDFYEGDLARAIVSDLESRGGQLTLEDLATYEAVVRRPVESTLGGWRFDLNPAPAVGGITVAHVLELLSQGDPDDALDLARALVSAFQARHSFSLRSPSTISVAAADEEGGVASASFSAGYGSGVIPGGTGMLMNNALGELELSDGSGQPGRRMVSNMAPTVARSGPDAVAVGSPGADRITTAVATTLARLAAGDGLREAIDHPRAHPELGEWGVRLAIEPGLDLEDAPHPLRPFDTPHMYFGGVNGAGLMDGKLVAHADGRRTGSVAFTTP